MMVRCEDCGALYPDAWPADDGAARAIYAGYYTAPRRRCPWRAWFRRLTDWTRRPYLDRGAPADARTILDYGCGAGDYLARFADRAGFGTDLIAPETGAVAFTWLAPGEIGKAAPFDWITLGHVLEHLAEPAAVLARLAARLAPGGGLWIATPNADSFLFTAAGPCARDIDFPRHREIFSRRGMERLAAGAGLTCQFASPPRLNAVLNTAATVRNILRDSERGVAVRAGLALRTLLALAVHLAEARPSRDRDSPELIAICRRAASDIP
ncbi:MAG: methyltransferase domain-containing protein [Caulobacteraceae bacterium]